MSPRKKADKQPQEMQDFDETQVSQARSILEALPAGFELADKLFDRVEEEKRLRELVTSLASVRPMTREDERQCLADVAAAGKSAASSRKKLQEANLALVIWIAKDFHNDDVQLMDLINEGTIGLIQAVESYQENEALSFSVYAACMIKQSISVAVAEETRSKRVPDYLLEKINSLKHVARRLAEAKGCEPTRDEIAREMGLSPEELDRLIGLAKMKPVVVE